MVGANEVFLLLKDCIWVSSWIALEGKALATCLCGVLGDKVAGFNLVDGFSRTPGDLKTCKLAYPDMQNRDARQDKCAMQGSIWVCLAVSSCYPTTRLSYLTPNISYCSTFLIGYRLDR
jgi:hypothetical protein